MVIARQWPTNYNRGKVFSVVQHDATVGETIGSSVFYAVHALAI
jgi:hypothetical protein